MSQDSRDVPIAYISRCLDETGRPSFSGYVATSDSNEAVVVEEGGDWTSIDHGLEWARARARRVVLSYGSHGDGVFSAGTEYYDGGDASQPLLPWPPPAHVLSELEDRSRQLAQKERTDSSKLGVSEEGVTRAG